MAPPSLEVAVPSLYKNQAETLEDQKPAEILDRAAAADASGADASGKLMTSDKEEQPKQGRGLKRRRSADTA